MPDFQERLDYERFADSLEIDQAAFLVIALKGSKNQRYYPLREALEKRVASSPISQGLGKLVSRRFFNDPEERTE